MICSWVQRPGGSPVIRPSRITSAVGHLQQFRHFRADHQNSRSFARQLVHQVEHLNLRANVDAACRLIEEKNLRLAKQPLGDHHFLLVASAEPPSQLSRRTGADTQASYEIVGCGVLRAAVQEAKAADGSDVGERDIVRNR
jgi:hypothetical protein